MGWDLVLQGNLSIATNRFDFSLGVGLIPYLDALVDVVAVQHFLCPPDGLLRLVPVLLESIRIFDVGERGIDRRSDRLNLRLGLLLGLLLRPRRGARQFVDLRPVSGVVEADGRWLIPGLWDQHVHLGQWTLASARLDLGPARSSEEAVALVEAYAKEQSLWHDPARELVFSEYMELDLGTVVPSIASRVFPVPPGPDSVTSRWRERSPPTAARSTSSDVASRYGGSSSARVVPQYKMLRAPGQDEAQVQLLWAFVPVSTARRYCRRLPCRPTGP